MKTVPEELKTRIRAWRDAAIADGWKYEPLYANEEPGRNAKLTREGFIVHVLTRDAVPNQAWEHFDLSAWGPDKLALEVPYPYSWDQLQANLKLCGECNTVQPTIFRCGFANRVCYMCLPNARKRLEKPGWTS